MTHFVAVDVGGTQIRAGLYRSSDFSPVKDARAATRHATETAVERLLNLVASIWPAEGGVRLAEETLARSGTFIGYAAADFPHIFNPIIIIGGGVAQSGRFLLDPMRKAMEERILTPYYLDQLPLTTAALGDDAGLMGALAPAADLSGKLVYP